MRKMARTMFTVLFYLCCGIFGSCAVVPAPSVKDTRHISLYDIRVSWEPTVTSQWNSTEDITGFEVGLSKDNCVTLDKHTAVCRKSRSATFWGVTGGPYRVCVQTKTSNETSDWGSVSVKNEVRRPPRITVGPTTHKIYYPSENISLPCLATGSPAPQVHWYGNNKVLKSGANGTFILPNGTLFIVNAQSTHQGSYRCQASSNHGVAVSDSALLEFSVLESFPHQETRIFTTPSGHSQRLSCSQKPHSIPAAEVSWYRADSEKLFRERQFDTVRPSHRIALGPDGSLLFVFVVKADNGFYKCELWNNELDRGVSGSASILKVEGDDMLGTIRPSLLESSSENVFALQGEKAEITCIFSGRSTPDILWHRVGGLLDARHHTRDNNRTLVIYPVNESDAGFYECTGSNKDDNGPQYSQPAKFKLIVNARPTWKEKPAHVNATVGDNVTFKCRADGVPPPTVHWLVNGENIHMRSQSTTSSMSVNKDGDLVIEHVTKADMCNIQCNVSNSNGYLFTDAYLNVVYPTTITDPPSDVILVPSHVVRFTCSYESDPGTPVMVEWSRGNKAIVYEDQRIYITQDHTLVLNTSLAEDGGLSFVASYTCSVSNGIDVKMATAKLRPPANTLSQVEPKPSLQLGEGQDLMLIGLTAGLAAIVIICLVLLTVYRKRHEAMMSRSGTDTSVLTILSSASRTEDEGASPPPQCDMTEFPLLPYLDDESLEQKIKEVLILRSRIEIGKTLGKGQFGRVYAGMLKGNGRTGGKGVTRVAVKTLKYKPEETEIVELFLREAVMMKDFKHEHVLSLIGISVDEDGSPMVILPLMENSDLRIYVQDPEKEITVLELLKLGLQVARGMIYLSHMRFIHRDLAARNCMVDAHGVVKVADFGLSRDLFARDYYRIEDGKTPLPVRWMAPESLTKSVFTTLSDVWSYGVLLWELMTRGAVPYPDVDNWDIAHYIQSGKRLAQPLYCPDSIYDVMLACWEDEPGNRPTFERIVKDIETIVDSARAVPNTSSHLYLNIHSMAAVSDYREVTHTTV